MQVFDTQYQGNMTNHRLSTSIMHYVNGEISRKAAATFASPALIVQL